MLPMSNIWREGAEVPLELPLFLILSATHHAPILIPRLLLGFAAMCSGQSGKVILDWRS